MSIEANIQSAIADLAAEPTELDEIAAEYGIKPEVLLVRFERAHGCAPEGYAAKQAAFAASQTRQAEDKRAADAAAWERELDERRAICEFFATTNHGMGRGVTNAARSYLRSAA